jgi:hypothetical protein
MSKQAFEEANELFVDDKYEEAYEVRNFKKILSLSLKRNVKTLTSSFTRKLLIVMIKQIVNLLRKF